MGIETPCIGTCSIEPTSGSCVGCGRTLAEIAAWSRLAPDERRRIMRRLAGRKQPMTGDLA